MFFIWEILSFFYCIFNIHMKESFEVTVKLLSCDTDSSHGNKLLQSRIKLCTINLSSEPALAGV